MSTQNVEKRSREAAKLEGRTEGAEDVRELVSRVTSLFEQELARAMASPGELFIEDAELALEVRAVLRKFVNRMDEAIIGLVDAHKQEHQRAIDRFVTESRGAQPPTLAAYKAHNDELAEKLKNEKPWTPPNLGNIGRGGK